MHQHHLDLYKSLVAHLAMHRRQHGTQHNPTNHKTFSYPIQHTWSILHHTPYRHHHHHCCSAPAHHGTTGHPCSQHRTQAPTAAKHPCARRGLVRVQKRVEKLPVVIFASFPFSYSFHREAYSMEHVHRLLAWEARTPWTGSKCNVYCNQQHVQPCHACTTCHFCRQKTVDRKTTCSRCGRGHWCAACLYERAGQHMGMCIVWWLFCGCWVWRVCMEHHVHISKRGVIN